jgi:hypothetical protein
LQDGTLVKLIEFNGHGYWTVEANGQQFTVDAIRDR